MTKGIVDADAQTSALRLALGAIVDALVENKAIGRSDIVDRLREREERLGDSVESAELIRQLRDLRKFLE